MRACPLCGAGPELLKRADEGDTKGGPMSPEELRCDLCGKRFSVLKGRPERILVPTRDVDAMRVRLERETATNQVLKKKAADVGREARTLRASLKVAKEAAYSRSLQARAAGLEQYVAFLKKEKGALEELLAKMS